MNKILSFAIFLLSTFSSFSQSSDWIWAKSSTADEGSGVAIDKKGNIYASGLFIGTANFDGLTVTDEDPNLPLDIFLVKYSQTGNAIWVKGGHTSNGSAFEEGIISNNISIDNSGNIFMTGTYTGDSVSIGSTTLPSSVDDAFFIAKYDSSGNALWAKGITNPGGTMAEGIGTDGEGNAYVIGYYDGDSINFEGIHLSNSSFFIAKYNATGNLVWAKSPTTPGATGRTAGVTGGDISVSNEGNIYITGNLILSSVSFGSTTIVNQATQYAAGQYFVVKYDSAGNDVWAKTVSLKGTKASSYSSEGRIIAIGNNENVYVTGTFANDSITFDGITLPNDSGTKSFLAKYDSSGRVIWAREITQWGWNIATDAGDNVYISGPIGFHQDSIIFDSTIIKVPGKPLYTSLRDPMFLVTLDPNGNMLCGVGLLSGSDDPGGLCTDKEGNVYLVQDFISSPLIIGGDTFVFSDGADDYENFYIAKYKCANAVIVPDTINTTTINDTICTGDSIVFNGKAYNATGIYIDSFSVGNDKSLEILNLTVRPIAYGITKARICIGDTFQGHITPGIYYDTIKAPNSCDSLITLELQIDTLPSMVPISQNGDTLSTLPGYDFYYWYQDNGTLLITGEDSAYVISHSGRYYVTISNDTANCVKTSSVITAYTTSIQQPVQSIQHLTIYPNPAQNTANIEWQPITGQLQLSLSDMLGNEVSTFKVDGRTGNTQLKTNALSNGLYLVKLVAGNGNVVSGKLAVVK